MTTVAHDGGLARAEPEDASLWRRFMGMAYEAMLLVGPVMVLAFVYGVLVDQTDAAGDPHHWKVLGLQALLFCSVVGYFGWGWSRGRVTLPMQTLGLQLVDASSGGPISWQRAFARAAVAGPFVFSGLWLLGAWWMRSRQTPYDRLFSTRLVYRPLVRHLTTYGGAS